MHEKPGSQNPWLKQNELFEEFLIAVQLDSHKKEEAAVQQIQYGNVESIQSCTVWNYCFKIIIKLLSN